MQVRLCVLVSHPVQYFASVYRELAARDDVELHVLFRTRAGVDLYFDEQFGQNVQWDTPLVEGYAHEFLTKKVRMRGIEWSVIQALTRVRPQVLLLHGYNYATNLIALAVAKAIGVRVLLRGDTRLSARHDGAWIRRLVKRGIFRQFDGFVSIGTRNAEYYQAMGVSQERIHFSPFSVDNALFDSGPAWAEMREQMRTRLQIDGESTVVVFAAKLVARKRAMDLLAAFEEVSRRYPRTVLVIAGSGPEERVLRDRAGTGDNVRFVGFRNQSALPVLFAGSDVFVLPSSEEPWGLGVNEAMAAGLPVVVSDEVGAATDLVEGKGTGLIFPVGDISGLAKCVSSLVGSRNARIQMGLAGKTLISNWSPAHAAAGIARAANIVVGL